MFIFINDIWGISEGSREELDAFIAHINSCHASTKFTAQISQESVVSLDVRTYAEGEHIFSMLHMKETDSHSYLAFDSCHPITTNPQYLTPNSLELGEIVQNGLILCNTA